MGIDNRIMYTVGAAAKSLRLLDSDIIIGISLSATVKNPFFLTGSEHAVPLFSFLRPATNLPSC